MSCLPPSFKEGPHPSAHSIHSIIFVFSQSASKVLNVKCCGGGGRGTCSKLTGTISIYLCVSQRSYCNALHLSVLGNSRLSEWMIGIARSSCNLRKHKSHSASILTPHLSQNRRNSIGNTSQVFFFFSYSPWNLQVHLMMPLQPPTLNPSPNSKILSVAWLVQSFNKHLQST